MFAAKRKREKKKTAKKNSRQTDFQTKPNHIIMYNGIPRPVIIVLHCCGSTVPAEGRRNQIRIIIYTCAEYNDELNTSIRNITSVFPVGLFDSFSSGPVKGALVEDEISESDSPENPSETTEKFVPLNACETFNGGRVYAN